MEIDASDDRQRNSRKLSRKVGVLLTVTFLFVIAGIGWFLAWYYNFSRREVTDNAYVGGNQVVISSRIDGSVSAILVDETEHVTGGQSLVRLDTTDAQLAIDLARDALSHAVRENIQQRLAASQQDAAVAGERLELARAQSDLLRRQPMFDKHLITMEDLAHARFSVDTARAGLAQATQQAAASRAMFLGTSITESPDVMVQKTAFREAWINGARNEIRSPVAGEVARRTVQIGQRIKAGQALMTVVPLDKLWIDANFKEGQLAKIRIGQPALVNTDLYGDAVLYHGVVVGIGAGTGNAFSLLPAQNASGNWIKVLQRVPVRIALDPAELKKSPLRIGLSATVTVDTSARPSNPGSKSNKAVFDESASGAADYFGRADLEADTVIRNALDAR
jgi:membrane fusion protein (multidrug efflux system)